MNGRENSAEAGTIAGMPVPDLSADNPRKRASDLTNEVVVRPYSSWLRASGVGRDLRDTAGAVLSAAIVSLSVLNAVLSGRAVWIVPGATVLGLEAFFVWWRYASWRLHVAGPVLEHRPLFGRRSSITLGDGSFLAFTPRGIGHTDLFRARVALGGADGRTVQLRDGGDVDAWLADDPELRGLPRRLVERSRFSRGRALRLTAVTFTALGLLIGGLVLWGAIANR